MIVKPWSKRTEVPKQQDWKPSPENAANSWLFSGSAANEVRKVRTDAERLQREHREEVRQRLVKRQAGLELLNELGEVWDER